MGSAGTILASACCGVLLLGFGADSFAAEAQPAAASAPAVGVVRAARQQITETQEFIARVQAVDKVSLVARVSAFLEKRAFVEGSEIKKGDLLYQLEQPPYQAQVDAAKANVDQLDAQYRNAQTALERARVLYQQSAGSASNLDAAEASERGLAAQIDGAKAQLRSAQINLDYTEIRAPIDGRITSTAVTEGNLVSPTTGVLATIVSQDPMYVVYQTSVRNALELRSRYGPRGGFSAVVIKVRLPDGRIYSQAGKLAYVAPTVADNTDTLTERGEIPNPVLPGRKAGEPGARELVDGEYVTVLLEGVEPISAIAIPRTAVLADQKGQYVYVVDAQNKAQIRRIQLSSQSTPLRAVVASGLAEGEMVITEGVQRVRPDEVVSAGPANAQPGGEIAGDSR
jgi:membrane fusion protein, multidrug efflux system